MSTLKRLLAAGFTLFLLTGPAHAQTQYPTKPVRMIVPFPPGGAADLVARALAERFFEDTNQSLIIENRPGAEGIIALQALKNAAADGYTMGLIIEAALTMHPTIYDKIPYDVERDFTPVMSIARVGGSIAVHPSLSVQTINELATLIRDHPGKEFHGTGATQSKVAMETFAHMVNGKMTAVSYKGSPQSMHALLAGDVKISYVPLATVAPHMQSGKIRVLAVADSERSKAFPDIPTVSESGVPGFAVDNWYTLTLPANVAPAAVQQIHSIFSKAALHPEVQAKVSAAGVEMMSSTPDEALQRLRSENERWSKTIPALGIKMTLE